MKVENKSKRKVSLNRQPNLRFNRAQSFKNLYGLTAAKSKQKLHFQFSIFNSPFYFLFFRYFTLNFIHTMLCLEV
jgi:hypothetical protein